MTSHWCDFQNTDVILHCGSNSVENHPISSKWLNKAHERGAKWIVVDPRYTRTAEMADIYCPIRSGTDIAFYGGMYNYIVQNLIEPNLQDYLAGKEVSVYNFEYLLNYTNASFLLDPEYAFDVELGLFSGYEEATKTYSNHSWHYQTASEEEWDTDGDYAWSVAPGVPEFDKPVVEHPKQDMTLQDPMCVYQQFKQHYSRYDLDTVCSICGMSKETLEEVYKTYCESAPAGKSGMILYAFGQGRAGLHAHFYLRIDERWRH
jgi:formate dehydrogenase major subunit